eukprot:TRINITY_DN18948_c0_g1_i1.p1 TRINITY_DN18948_c0_g1~~TRINITY_DN18948_c0_g1_i1.p1  ORF type:complete len:124 (+),score=10.33 TRINITY_DN18948_c0_g1_i1:271-642(+)
MADKRSLKPGCGSRRMWICCLIGSLSIVFGSLVPWLVHGIMQAQGPECCDGSKTFCEREKDLCLQNSGAAACSYLNTSCNDIRILLLLVCPAGLVVGCIFTILSACGTCACCCFGTAAQDLPG